MTADEKEKIKELRLNGKGYKAIANITGLSWDSVRSFCKRNSLEGDSCVVALNHDEKINRNLLCVCQKPIKQKSQGRTRKFCSADCRWKWWNGHEDARNKKETTIYKYTCPYCGKRFSVYGNKKRKYCSHD